VGKEKNDKIVAANRYLVPGLANEERKVRDSVAGAGGAGEGRCGNAMAKRRVVYGAGELGAPIGEFLAL